MSGIARVGVDCHIHLFGDPLRYPPVADRTYTPTPATLSQWRAISEPLGVRRAVLVQPSAYGADNTRLLDGLREAGDMARGVVVIDDTTPDYDLVAMNGLGVRGVRFNLVTCTSSEASCALARLRTVAARIACLGWHLQVYARGAILEHVVALVPSLGVPVVFDHMAGARSSLGLEQPGFQTVLRLFREGKCWIKISGADHVSSRRDSPEEALPIMRKLVEANSDQLVWGSDWPHIGKAGGPQSVEYLAISHDRLLALLREAASGVMRQILMNNPTKLYGWV